MAHGGVISARSSIAAIAMAIHRNVRIFWGWFARVAASLDALFISRHWCFGARRIRITLGLE